MKNIKQKDLDNFSSKESIHGGAIRSRNGYWRRYDRQDWCSGKDLNVYNFAEYVLKNNIGKSFDLAFSYFCKHVSQRFQYVFLERFNGRSYRSDEWSVDNNRLLVYKPYRYNSTNKTGVDFYSDDYESELVHKISGHKKDDFKEVYEKIENFPKLTPAMEKYHAGRRWFDKGKFLYYLYGENLPLCMRYKAQKKDFHLVTVKGWKMHFESRNDPRYIRLNQEKIKRKKTQERKIELEKSKQKIEEANKALQEVKRKEREKEQEEANRLKILRKGFDPETSFKK